LPKQRERAIALTPGDWASLRDILIDMATEIDALKVSRVSGPVEPPGAAVTSNDGAPGHV